MGRGFGMGIRLAGNAKRVIDQAARSARAGILKVVKNAASRVQRGAKINVNQVLNTTGKSSGTLGGSITIIPNPAKLEASIGPSVIYGRIHELGGVIEDGFGKGIRIVMPKRAYLQPALDDAEPTIKNDFEQMAGDLLME